MHSKKLLGAFAITAVFAGVFAASERSPVDSGSQKSVELAGPKSMPVQPSDRIVGIPVEVTVRNVEPLIEVTRTYTDVGGPEPADPLRKGPPPYPKGVGFPMPEPYADAASRTSSTVPPAHAAPLTDALKNPPTLRFESIHYDDNSINDNFRFIPPDTHNAVGPNHVVNVVNAMIRIHNKSGTPVFTSTLRSFFTAAGITAPVNATFDPKVLYDTFSNRYVLVTLELTAADSAVFVAVSATNDPTGSWFLARIPAVQSIGGNNCWFDYPGFGVDEEAVYITGNYFRLDTNANCGETRLFVVGKAAFYAGLPLVASIMNPTPAGSGGLATTQQPALVYGTAPIGVGTFLASFSGITINGGTESAVQVVRIDNPLAVPTVNVQFIGLGQLLVAVAGTAPQSGSATPVATGDRRSLQAVWRNNRLHFAFGSRPPAASADAAENAAWWGIVNTTTLGTLTRTDFGKIGGDDITPNAHTAYPSIAVNDVGDLAIGFSVTGAAIFPSSAYTWRAAGDAAGTTRASQILRAGTDFYVRTFSGTANRWGDYSGTAVDPVDNCFWISNQHAVTRGNPNGGDGKWQVSTARFCGSSSGTWPGFANGFE